MDTDDQVRRQKMETITSPREVISRITGREFNKNLTPHLERMFESSRNRQLRAGVRLNLPSSNTCP